MEKKLTEYERFHWLSKEYKYNELPPKTQAEIQEICQPSCESFKIIKQGNLGILPIFLIIGLCLWMYIKYLNSISFNKDISQGK